MYALRGIFDREGGALIATGLEALMKPTSRDDFRTAGQRRADALVAKFKQGVESPQLTVICEPARSASRWARRQASCVTS